MLVCRIAADVDAHGVFAEMRAKPVGGEKVATDAVYQAEIDKL